ncbi:hypothetical protein [Streptomyces violascens]|uniref:Uncharacterized protein n=1 Tax=Streptomyces violascens TaxID=67381 RepID=A0ABQ3QLC3_9ACTN|nr:hypothetical protein [Streptomyces violascens]GGU44598.1 hypothetical protein GCM10010289_76480 [Streptomyces violascens]GHI38019.1 hypothetical protein Sviol_24270 [Streptomyces violascens]
MATPASPDRTSVQTAGDQIKAAVAAPAAPAAPVPLEAQLRANAAAATPEAQPELPLWTGNDLPPGATWTERDGVLYDTYNTPQWNLKAAAQNTAPPSEEDEPVDPRVYDPKDAYIGWSVVEPVDLAAAFAPVAEAWADIVPPEHGSAQDLVTAVGDDLRVLEQAWRRTVPGPPARSADNAAATGADAAPPADMNARQDASAVNAALQQADQHADALKDLPEWQRLQTVRGAATHLWNTIREKAGQYFERLADDVRVQGFWRTVSVRACEAIAHGCQEMADELRSGAKGQNLPAAEALLKVSNAALAYSSPRSERPDDATVAAAQQSNLTEIRQLRTTLASNEPLPYATREEATAASRDVAAAFQTWAGSDMGKELCTSSTHPRVVEFREAWQQLPPADLPAGPGSAAGPFGDVAERAQGIVERAQAQPGRFAQADLAALKVVADLAAHHSGRLAVTLPPDLTGPTASVQQIAPRPAVAVPAARSGGASRSA